MVSIWDQIDRDIEYLRQQAEDGMRDRLRCERPTGRTTRIDGKTVPEMETIWAGRGKVQNHQSYPTQPQAGGTTAALAIYEVHLPAGEPTRFQLDDVFVVEESDDLQLVGRRFRYRVDPVKTWRTARRFNCEEVTR